MFTKLYFLLAFCMLSIASGNETLVIGGVEAVKHQYPWLVRLYISIASGVTRRCTGSLISLDLVLTSATCVNGTNSQIIVIAGDHSIFQNDGTEQSLLGQEIITHENFNRGGNLENDIALIRLPSNLTETRAVKPLFLPLNSYNTSQATWGTVAGWGETRFSEGEEGPSSSTLMKANVTLLTEYFCEDAFPTVNEELQFCAEGDGKGAYKGDFGGPLLCNGMTIFCGIFTREIDFPPTTRIVGLFLNVVPYLDWIEEKMNLQPPTSTTEVSTTPQGGESTTSSGNHHVSSVILIAYLILMC
ncbi:Kallikrein-11 [Orchesella cincta]|uniref:Kallikrein-11 n=1 Tax=Orchesella cincta TaxID=48709 RepID=A0A1D2MCC7_ORCCI|nr:Kallikrein-11 [Orchesella cincta]